MVESIARVEWIQRKVFNVGGSSTGSERIGKHLKGWRGEGVETKMFATSKGCNTSGAEETCKNYKCTS